MKYQQLNPPNCGSWVSGSYTYTYNKDRELTNIHFPSGKEIVNTYTDARLTGIATPEGNIDLGYLAGSRPSSIVKGSERIDYGYDGSLIISETLSGTINQAIGYTYNNDFNVSSLTYAGRSFAYGYDNDGLLTSAGDFTITRNAANGLPEAVSIYLPPSGTAILPGNRACQKAFAAVPGYRPLLALDRKRDVTPECIINDAAPPRLLLAFVTLKMTSLTVQGTASVDSGATSAYTAIATYSDGSSSVADATFSLNPTAYATISSGGALSAGSVSTNQTITVTAIYNYAGDTFTASMNVAIIAPESSTYLSGLTIQGPASVNAGTITKYSATASYSDGSSGPVGASFSLGPNASYAANNITLCDVIITGPTITPEGLLSAGDITTNMTVTVFATYTEDGITRNASMDVQIIVPSTLTYLYIQGASQVNPGGTSSYVAVAEYSDGSSKFVNAPFSLSATTAATISSDGVLSPTSAVGTFFDEFCPAFGG